MYRAPLCKGGLWKGNPMKERTIYALGFFDGVHLGHQALLKACRHLADRHGCFAGVVTFTSHPDGLVLGKAPAFINTLYDRKQLLSEYEVDTAVCLPFDENLMFKSWQDFLEDLTKKGGSGFVCGEDFRFGYKGEGTAEKLAAFCEERGLPYVIVPQQELDGTRVSSTYIRSLLEAGKMEEAVRFLGHPHILSGIVVKGRGLGHTIGIPTANLALPAGVICPKKGVYASKALVDGQVYPALTNIGNRPTVDGESITVETWIPDFAGDLYGMGLRLELYKFIREERKFPNLAALKEEIQKNKEEIFHFFGKN